MKKIIATLILASLLLPLTAREQYTLINNTKSTVQMYFEVESGLVSVTNRRYQVGRLEEGATNFDFVSQGGQDVFYPFDRYTAGLKMREKHHIGLLYQSLEINTAVTFREMS